MGTDQGCNKDEGGLERVKVGKSRELSDPILAVGMREGVVHLSVMTDRLPEEDENVLRSS